MKGCVMSSGMELDVPLANGNEEFFLDAELADCNSGPASGSSACSNGEKEMPIRWTAKRPLSISTSHELPPPQIVRTASALFPTEIFRAASE
eukprot:1210006-Rhodomonas_salina.1